MTRELLIFGDSNTYGAIPMTALGVPGRYDAETRWPDVVARELAPDWEVVAEGLPGRTAQFDDPVNGAHMNGGTGLRIALESHGPIDQLVIMLGTNDAKKRFMASPEMITAGLAGLVDLALHDDYQQRHGGFDVLLICPPPVIEVGVLNGEFQDSAAVSQGLAPVLRDYCAKRGIGFFDAGEVFEVSPVDGVHYEAEAHIALGKAVAKAIKAG
ncbi:MAG: SGNH/GDSL hydrolase family protein [Maritimibacter sp.]